MHTLSIIHTYTHKNIHTHSILDHTTHVFKSNDSRSWSIVRFKVDRLLIIIITKKKKKYSIYETKEILYNELSHLPNLTIKEAPSRRVHPRKWREKKKKRRKKIKVRDNSWEKGAGYFFEGFV